MGREQRPILCFWDVSNFTMHIFHDETSELDQMLHFLDQLKWNIDIEIWRVVKKREMAP